MSTLKLKFLLFAGTKKKETFENDRVPGMNHAEKKTTVSFGQGHKMKLCF